MNYSKKDVLTGLIIVLVIIAGFYLYKHLKEPVSTPISTPQINYKKQIEDSFNFKIPENIETFELTDVSGGDNLGIATKNEILADLKDPQQEYFYQAWLKKSVDQTLISLGKLRIAKGGWLLDYDLNKYPNYDKIIVSLEKDFDNEPETIILEGSI